MQHVVISGVRSNTAKVLSDVPQGTVLDPLLFLIYINDIIRVIKYSNVKIFVDDSKLVKVVNRMGDWTNLQLDLVAVIQWSQKHNMQLNEKFELIHFGKMATLKQPYILPSGERLTHQTPLGTVV
ncbi:uncharacterized protein LOC128248538 [Octopus bimaculoides]|uniref:uncharacterized protein LOC128248538 n=1 Tax=Octopus bimaculoides TaxID=37653 RepID=UPI0022DFE68C|nr:uncharacterized protein LOC128248538 [Octopus bimaculoides]